MQRINVQVPATTANLGPGFDCLGMALDIWNHLQFQLGDAPGVQVEGQGAGHLSTGPDNLVYQAANRYFQETGAVKPSFSISCRNQIPLARGMGSSSAAIVGGLLGASAMAGDAAADPELIWHLAVAMEGHPDNVTPALFGGCQIVVRDQEALVRATVPLPGDLQAVLFVPDTRMPTVQARDILPPQVSREDAVYNMGRVALLINALATGRVDDLRVATQDRLHQPARQAIFPAMRPLFDSAMGAGALGVFLSGAGSAVLALTRGKEAEVGEAMADSAGQAGVQGEVKVASLSAQGAHVTGTD
ncbi:MAG: homoserine kinase [Dehalococcoidia bacterium]